MFRPGENWVYDLFIFFLKIWWGILKAILVVVYYLIQRAPSHPSAPRKQSTQTLSLRNDPITLKLTALAVLVFGSVLIGVSAHQYLRAETFPGGRRAVEQPLLLVFLCGLVLLAFGVYGLHRVRSTKHAESAETAVVEVTFTIHVPRTTAWDAEIAGHFVNKLLFACPQVLLSIVADHERITWQVLDVRNGAETNLVEEIARASYPDAEIRCDVYFPPEVDQPFYRYICYYQQVNPFVAPILYVDDFKSSDPLNALTQAMNSLHVGERVTFMVALAGDAADAYRQGERLVTQSTIHPLQFLSRRGVGDAAGKVLSGRDRMNKYEHRDQKVLEDKLRAKLYYAYVWMQVDAIEPIRLTKLVGLMDTQLAHFTKMPFNALSWVERPLDSYTHLIETPEYEQQTHVYALYRRMLSSVGRKQEKPPASLILEIREIAALWHLPAETFSASRIQWGSGLREMPEAVTRQASGVVLGTGTYQGKEVPVRLPQADRLTHLNVIGKTGTGKSTLLHTLIHQDIANGAGVAVIDPHGQLVRDILRCSIPPSRETDVVVLDLANTAYPPPLNPLRGVQGYTSTLKMVGVIERLFAGTEGAARMASYLRAALIPLGSEAQATMRDVTRMFTDDVFREQCLAAIDDPETLDFWDYHYSSASPALQRQIAEPIINRVRPFYANPTLYPILCHPKSLDFRSLMQRKKIILISLALDEEHVPDQERNLIGALLISQLQMASMKTMPSAVFHLYVDEVQRFVTTSLNEMLSEARKYGLSLTTANQYLGQLTGKTLEAVMGNVGTSIIFRCSPDDAHDLAAYTKPQFEAQTLMDLDRFQAAVKLQVQGKTQPAFSLLTVAPLETPDDAYEREQRIRRHSIAHYTPQAQEEVLTWLKERYPRRRIPVAANGKTAEEATFYE